MDLDVSAAADRVRASYDATPYHGGAHYATHPCCIATVATMMGMAPASPDRCRVLELGCATGGNLNPMAAQLPDSEFTGIDLSATQIRAAQDMAEAAQLDNVRYEALDLMDLGRDVGQFDYIICHGVFSWVPEAVRARILEICRDHLTERGLAYISYNTQPGSQRRDLARGVARFGAAHVLEEGAPVAQILALWKAVSEAMPDPGHSVSRQLTGALEEIEDSEEFYIAHEYLEDINEPLWFYHVADAAHEAGLKYVGEAFRAADLSDFPGHTQAQIRSLSPTLIATEQLLDLAAQTEFRRSIFCREAVELDRSPDAERVLAGYAYASASRSESHPDGSVTFRTRSRRDVTTNHPLLIAALDLLHDAWPQGIRASDLYRMANDRLEGGAGSHTAEPAFAEALARLWVRNAIVLMIHPLWAAAEAGSHPLAHRLSRVQAARGAPVTNLLHQTVELPAAARRLLPFLDGTRDIDEIRALGTLEASQDGNGKEAPELLEGYLARFARLALICPPDGVD